MSADDPGSAEIIAVEAGSHTVALTRCPCGAVTGECTCDEVIAEWVRLSAPPIYLGPTLPPIHVPNGAPS